MKKLISALIAIAMIMSIGLPALATEPTPAPEDKGHTQVIAVADPDYMIVIPRTVNFGELNRNQPEQNHEFWIRLDNAVIDDGALITVNLAPMSESERVNVMKMYDKGGEGQVPLDFSLSSEEMGSVVPGGTYCTFDIEDVEEITEEIDGIITTKLTAIKNGTVSCIPANLRAAGSYRGWMTYEITYEYDGVTTDLEIPGDNVTIDFGEIDPPVTPTVEPTVQP